MKVTGSVPGGVCGLKLFDPTNLGRSPPCPSLSCPQRCSAAGPRTAHSYGTPCSARPCTPKERKSSLRMERNWWKPFQSAQPDMTMVSNAGRKHSLSERELVQHDRPSLHPHRVRLHRLLPPQHPVQQGGPPARLDSQLLILVIVVPVVRHHAVAPRLLSPWHPPTYDQALAL